MDVQHLRESLIFGRPDPRSAQWFLLWNDPTSVWLVSAAYIVFVLAGPRLMKHRPAFNIPPWFMIGYNATNVVLSCYIIKETVASVLDLEHNWLCAPYNEHTFKNPKEQRLASALWLYFFSKFIEFFDTVLMVLRKKNSQITFLHVFHHVTMLNIWWAVTTYTPGGCAFFSCVVNSFIHVVMYTYYALAAIPQLREWLWWKRYLTQMQLLQFVLVFLHTLQLYRASCDFPHWPKHLLATYMLLLITLFINFYVQSYKKKHVSSSNGTISSGKNIKGH